jgi:transposase
VPTEEQWDRILALVRAQDQAAHRPALPQRPIVEGILWVMEHSARWQDIPARFGAWKTIESRYYRWRKRGTWAAILTILSPTSAPHPAPP